MAGPTSQGSHIVYGVVNYTRNYYHSVFFSVETYFLAYSRSFEYITGFMSPWKTRESHGFPGLEKSWKSLKNVKSWKMEKKKKKKKTILAQLKI